MTPYIHKVQYYETDKMGITHHANYIRWMEEARVALLEEIGWGYDKLEELGIQSPVIGVECAYKAPTTFGDLVEVQVWVEEYRHVQLVIGYEMRKVGDGKVVLEGRSRHCLQHHDGRFIWMGKEYPDFDKALRDLVQETKREQ